MPLILSVVIGLLLAMAAGLVHVPPVRRYVLAQGKDYLQTSQQIDLQAAKLDYNLFGLSVTLHDVTIRAAHSPQASPFLTASRAYVNLNATFLIRGRFAVEEVVMEGVRVHLVADEKGEWNLPRQQEDARAPPATIPEVLIDSLTAVGSQIIVEDRRQAAVVQLPQWRLSIDGQPSTLEHAIRFAIERAGEASLEARRLPVEELALRLLWRGERLQVRDARLRLGGSRVAIGGRIDNLPEPVLSLGVDSRLQVGELAQFTAGRGDLAGQVELRASLTGSLSAPRVSGRLQGNGLAFGAYEGIGLEAGLSRDPGTKVVEVNPLAVRSPYGNVEGVASLATESGESGVDATFRNVDLARLSRQLKLDTRIGSTASGDITARWPALEWDAADGRASVRLATRREPTEKVVPVRGRLDLTAQSGRFRFAVTSLEALGTATNGTVSLDRQKNLGGTLQLEAGDIAGLLASVNAVLGKEPAEQPIAGGVRLAARLAGTLENPRVAVEVEGEPLRAGDIRDVALRARADYESNQIRIPEAVLAWRGQSVRASGEVGLAGETPKLQLEVLGEGIEIPPVLSAFLREPPIEGVVDFTASVSGTTEQPSAKVQLTGAGLRAYGESWGQLTSEATYQDGRIEVAALQLEKPGSGGRTGALAATGSYTPESQEYSFEVKADLELAGLALPSGSTLSGRLLADASGTGLVSNPAADIEAEVSGLVIDERQLGNFNISARVAEQVAEGVLRAPRLGVDARVRASTQSPYAGEFDIAASFDDLSVLAIHGPDSEILSGALRGTLRGAGELANWKTLDARARLEQLRAVVNQQEIRAAQPIEARLDGAVLRVEPAVILAGGAQISLGGALPLEAARSSGEEFRLDVDGTLESLLAFIPDLGEISAKGILQARARVRGGLDRPEPNLTATLRDGEIALPNLDQPVTAVELDAETRNREIVLDRLAAQWAGATLSATASVPLGLLSEALRAGPSSAPARFQIAVRDLNPGAVQGAPAELSGTVALQLEGEASSLELAALSAEARFDELRLRIGELEIGQSAPARISLRDGLASVDSLELAGRAMRITATGTALLEESQTLDLRVAGTTDASLFTSFMEDLRATGPTQFELAAAGTLREPKITGNLRLRDGRVVSEAPPVQGENVALWMRFTPGLLEIIEGTGALNGGQFKTIGFVSYGPDGLQDINLLFDVDSMYVNFPEGLRTLSDARIRLTQRNDQILVAGRVGIAEGSFRDPLDPARILGSGGGVEFVEERDPLLSRIRFRVDVETDGPIVIDNELAKLMVTTDLVLVGSFYRPSVTGRLTIDEGGEIYLAEHKYVVDTGIIDFVNENKIQPAFNLLARTRAGGHDIDLRITGSPGDLETVFTSDTGLSEPDIISVLLTGRTLEESRDSELNIARQAAMSYLTGQLGGRFSRAAQETLGLSRVRIEPNLVSGESDPGARLTVGQDLRRDLRLIYSMNLVNSSDQILIGEYDLTRRFNIRGTNQSDNSRRLDFRHNLHFGGNRVDPAGRRSDIVVGRVEFTGATVIPAEVLRGKLDIEPGDRYDFFGLRRGLDRLERLYRDNDHLEARIRLQQERGPGTVDITIDVDAGPRVTFVFEGYSLPGGLRRRVRRIWQSGVFDAQRTTDTAAEIRRWFVGKRHLEAEVRYTINSPEDSRKSVLFEMWPGTRYREVNLVFDSAEGVGADELESLVRKEPDGFINSIVRPQSVVDLLTRFYRQQGYLSASVARPRQQLDPETGTGRVVFRVEEGPRFRFGRVEFTGNRAVSEAELRATITVYPKDAYRPETLRNSVEKLEELYWSRGYNDVIVQYQAERNAERREVDIRFRVDEQRQGVIERVEVTGNDEVAEGFIRRQLRLREGDILDYRKTELSRRALYKTGSFALVELETEPIAEATLAGGEFRSPLQLRASVREVVPYQIRYGGFYDTARGPGAIFDFRNRNSLLGGARLLGFRGRYDSDLHEVRGYFGQPFSFQFPSTASATTFVRRELRETFTTDRIGFSLLHELELRENMVYSYGYRFERAHTFEKEPDPFLPFDETLRIAPLTTSFSWDTRDELLDATRGFFLSNALEYAPSTLGSDLRYIKYFGQFFKYVPLTKPSEIPFGRGLKRPRVIYAGGVRVGLAGGFGGQSVVPSERFFAGGGTTVRGFKQDALGPVDFFGDPVGGEALFIANNELRFPLMRMFEAVGFVDIGNIYERAVDFNPFDVRSSVGVGLRVRTPYFLLRFDYGFKLDRKSGESLGAFFFSIGQAF